MSDTFLRIIPTEPAFQPSRDAQVAAEERLRRFLPGVHVESRLAPEIGFVDAGGSFGAIACPFCRAELEQDWWGEAMGVAAGDQFADLSVTTPCCERATTLGELDYEMPVGFARFVLEAADPNVAEVPAQTMSELEAALGCRARVIWARY